MKSRILAALSLWVFGTLLLIGCDTHVKRDTQSGLPGQIGSTVDSPFLFNIEAGQENLCAGSEIVLVGVNFSSVLEKNLVMFRFQNARIPGLPVRVEFPTDKNPGNGLESRLHVKVPTGVATGNVELTVTGIFAGSASYFACPQIVSYGIGDTGQEPRLLHGGPLGFVTTIPPIKVVLFGLNFDEVDRILVSDSQGGQPLSVPQNLITLRPIARLPNNNLQQLGFSLQGLNLAVVNGQRDNITVRVGTPKYTSNEVQVPVADSQEAATKPGIGAVINGILVPPGVRTGPVRIRYSMYDFPLIDQAYAMEVQWSADGGAIWHAAQPVINVFGTPPIIRDPEQDGFPIVGRAILPGAMNYGSPCGILYSGGDLRTFTWDAQNDADFRDLNNSADPRNQTERRDYTLLFRIHPRSEIDVADKPADSGHFIVSPPVSYYDLEDRGTKDNSSARRGTVLDNFDQNSNEDITPLDPQINPTKVPPQRLFPARWGPPDNPGSLRGDIPSDALPQAGLGTFDLEMKKSVPPQDGLLDEYFTVFAGDIMRIDHVLVIDDDANPTTPPLTISETVFPTVEFPNPGDDLGEFHLRTLFVESGMDVRLEGTVPAVFRVSGAENPLTVKACLQPDDCSGCRTHCIECSSNKITVCISGTLHANGDPGGSPTPIAAGAGGPGRCGGGAGGNGALWTSPIGANGEVGTLIRAQDGRNDGGKGGGTAGAVDSVATTNSKFLGAPGGGGGSFRAGGNGDPGVAKSPSNFTVPRGGRSGPQRGTSHLVPLIAGAGGGGGGGTIKKDGTAGTAAVGVNGSGGGGGGGAIRIVTDGNMVFHDVIRGGVKVPNIQMNGGKGANGAAVTVSAAGVPGGSPDSGAGGGGSGGCILLQATGFIDVAGDSLEVLGGLAGSMGQNQGALAVGEGEGSPGWIRVEPRLGGGPSFTRSFAFETTLTEAMTSSTAVSVTIKVASAAGFPQSGTVTIDKEVIAFRSLSGTSLGRLTRGIQGSTIAPHALGAKVVLNGMVTPTGGLVTDSSGTQYFEDPDTILTGTGADGLLHLRFIETTDPNTGLPLVDPVSGEHISVWNMESDTGSVTDPVGTVVLSSSASGSDTGQLSLSRLKIDPNVILRVSGGRPLRIKVTEVADIAGTIDLSGFDGDPIQFDVNNTAAPSPGLGGRSGPGGGDGGDGGSMIFLDKNLSNKDPANTLATPAKRGGLPVSFPPEFDRTGLTSGLVPPPDDLVGLETTRATPGDPLRDPSTCGGTVAVPCTAGGGGGGGARTAGSDGESKPSTAFGRGGSLFGLDGFRFGGGLALFGGQGGAGGGASAVVSSDYANKKAGPAIFQGAAKYGPGTGGGGGGGVLNLVVQGSLVIRSSGAILARGGNAYQSIDLAGNGGAGGGGSVLIQLANAFTAEPGARIDVSGGIANLSPPVTSDENPIPLYEGNVRKPQGQIDIRILGGRGGNGANGRVRFEVVRGSNLLKPSYNDTLSSSVLLPDSFPSIGVSKALPLGVGPGFMALSHMLLPEPPMIRFADQGIPDGTDAFVFWEGAAPSLDTHGLPGTFSGRIEDINNLYNLEYVRFSVQFLSNEISRETPTVTEIQLPVRLDNPANH